MSLRTFLSTVTAPNAKANRQPDPLRRWLDGELRKSNTHSVYQEFLIEQGVNTLVKLAQSIEKESEVVLHIVDDQTGSVPPSGEVQELLRHCGEFRFRDRFPKLSSSSAIVTPLQVMTCTPPWFSSRRDPGH